MVKDRTFEFRSTIGTISGSQTMLTGSYGYLTSPPTNQFLDKATTITREFSKISLKLEQLTKRKISINNFRLIKVFLNIKLITFL